MGSVTQSTPPCLTPLQRHERLARSPISTHMLKTGTWSLGGGEDTHNKALLAHKPAVSGCVSGELLNYHQQRRGSLSGSSQGEDRECSSGLIKILATLAGSHSRGGLISITSLNNAGIEN